VASRFTGLIGVKFGVDKEFHKRFLHWKKLKFLSVGEGRLSAALPLTLPNISLFSENANQKCDFFEKILFF
jgi:hypothetical protein